MPSQLDLQSDLQLDLKSKLFDLPIISFDTETSGAYPLGAEVVEFGAVKFFGGQVVDRMQVLIKPTRPLDPKVIEIHGLTDEFLLAKGEEASLVAPRIHHFLEGSVLIAHHAPFDMGFLAALFEKFDLPPLSWPVLCSSLLARNSITGVPNHKLQTLVKVFGIDQGQAHRAADDAFSCLQVLLNLVEKVPQFGNEVTLEKLFATQKKMLFWKDYQILASDDEKVRAIGRALVDDEMIEFWYKDGKSSRKAKPKGLVRNPEGDYLVAICSGDQIQKRFYLDRIIKIAFPKTV